MKKIIRVTTVPISLGGLLQGQLKFMSQHYEIIGVSSRGGDILEYVSEKEEVKVIPVEMTRKITPFHDLRALYQLYKIFRKEKPDIVHSHTPKAGTLSMMAARLAGIPHRLHTIAGLPLLEAKGIKRVILDTVEKITYSCATMIYPNSFVLKDIIVENKYTIENKLKVIAKGSSNGIDTSYFDPALYSPEDNLVFRKQYGIKASDFVFTYVGRLVTDKGVNELIKSFKLINQEYDHVKLLLVGPYEKDLDPVLPETEAEINTNPNIIAAGWQNDVRPFFAISDALTFPSYREGFPNVVMQAGSMGLPSIVTNINGCNEIVEHMVNGIIIPVKDHMALYENMKSFLEDKELFSKLSEKTRTMIVDRYERRYVWNSLLEEYKTITK
ncbi:glycosyltransferase family 4 protein [Aquimarina mytili]|uniref:Glycosyltransferase family 4 protein n=1 Tax=Aquimarina mytili TaxID=874423 RepID=A0A936ZP45_9FLAO|nr:glycosyltransferase family 4 protein [Aquimarina mytili]MBL0683174.1 glycosyltransferase family 4 protein [Aquimarina mytili]